MRPQAPATAAVVMAALIFLGSAGVARAGAWTQPSGHLWVKAAYLYQFTREIFAAEKAILPDGTRVKEGDRRPYDDHGAALQKTLWMEAEYGVTDRLTVGVQAPYHFLQFEDAFALTRSWGFGDIRFISRAALLTGRQRLTIRSAWKLALGKAATDPLDLPVSEGQSDFDLGLQWGMGLGRELSWLAVEGGYRWRLADGEGRDPGNEVFWRAEAGAGLVRAWGLGLKAAITGQRAATTIRDDLPEPGNRAFHAVEVALLWQFSRRFMLEPAVMSTFAGEAYPAGEMYSISLHGTFGL